ncbi:acetylserotonin O-methyltransferase-like [Mercurialis annua]|uniref:acetylserotonin O-methyltransferase-like n=1 Tax=Mercurialis annua TaxID=3986 RepID=UPI0021604C92|nr:acetylserotonin O-methyltransferase-like [Mercurialis annua]
MEETRISDSKIEKEEEEANEEAEAEVEIWNYIFGFCNMATVKCAIELGIADAIDNHHQGLMTLSELSSAVGCTDPSYLYRVMRLLVHQKIFKEKATVHGTTGYAHTPLSCRLLRRGDNTNSMADFVLVESSPAMLAPLQCLSNLVRVNTKNNSAFEEIHGVGNQFWKYAVANPGHSKLFTDALSSDARVVIPRIIEMCPEVFDGVKSLVDVGGGNGTTIGLLVKAFPWIKGINFDLPHVASVAPECDGVTHVGGDMFAYVPKVDAVIMKWILHDWNDEECIKILKKCREAIPKDKGKVIILDAVIGQPNEDKFEGVKLMLDIVIMAHTNTGKERTSSEWNSILVKAGFSHYVIKSIHAIYSIIVAFP